MAFGGIVCARPRDGKLFHRWSGFLSIEGGGVVWVVQVGVFFCGVQTIMEHPGSLVPHICRIVAAADIQEIVDVPDHCSEAISDAQDLYCIPEKDAADVPGIVVQHPAYVHEKQPGRGVLARRRRRARVHAANLAGVGGAGDRGNVPPNHVVPMVKASFLCAHEDGVAGHLRTYVTSLIAAIRNVACAVAGGGRVQSGHSRRGFSPQGFEGPLEYLLQVQQRPLDVTQSAYLDWGELLLAEGYGPAQRH